MQAKAGDFGFDPIDQTDTGADRLIYYFDTVGRSTYIQLTNTSDETVCVHVQAFEAEDQCRENDFYPCLTPAQTAVWNVATDFEFDLTESHGLIAISLESGPEFSLIGMFRIIDNNGYEYRTNAASSEDPLAFDEDFNILNYNDVFGNNFSDVIGITYLNVASDQVLALPQLGTEFGFFDFPQVLNFDEFENPISCSPVVFTCDDNNINSVVGGYINRGIDNSIPNSQGFPAICNTSRLNADNHAGWLFLPFAGYVCVDPDGTPIDCGDSPFGFDVEQIRFVGFLGLNNGGGQGSMDSWMSFSGSGLEPITPSAAD
ncbi:MAG TPA: hypothetical protein VHC46_08730 [Thermodesulfobacteriota bacterium]|nr:hypothetical protein [Thermodesulfobacteriota bacterium]